MTVLRFQPGSTDPRDSAMHIKQKQIDDVYERRTFRAARGAAEAPIKALLRRRNAEMML